MNLLLRHFYRLRVTGQWKLDECIRHDSISRMRRLAESTSTKSILEHDFSISAVASHVQAEVLMSYLRFL